MLCYLLQSVHHRKPPPAPLPYLNASVQVRAEQALLAELESEWLNQFWVQGRRHAALHPWWRGPMALLLATWRELERRTSATVHTLLSLPQQQQQQQHQPRAMPSLSAKGLSDSAKNAGGAVGERNKLRAPNAAGSKVAASSAAVVTAGGPEPAAIARAFDTVLRVLEERKESRLRWDSRFGDSAYRSLAPDCAPAVPALWSEAAEDFMAWERDGCLPLPKALEGVISRLRECYTEVYRSASGGKKAGSGKAIAAGAASNWELLRASSGFGSGSGSGSGLSPSPPPASSVVEALKTKKKTTQKQKRTQKRVSPQQQHLYQLQHQAGGSRVQEVGVRRRSGGGSGGKNKEDMGGSGKEGAKRRR